MKSVLVTGASGFVGGSLTRRLLRLAAETTAAGRTALQVRALVRSPEAAAQLADSGASVHIASLGDPNAIAAVSSGVDVVFHCASEGSHRASAQALSWINVAGTENVLNAARHAGVRRVVQLSCSDVTLVNRDRMSWKETQALTSAPLDAWARCKLLAEELALQQSDGALQVTALRPAWVWGPGDRSMAPALCKEAERGRVQLCGNGENLLPTVYIDNLVDALLAAADADKAPGHAYHIIDGEVLNASEFIAQLCTSLSLPAPARGHYGFAYALGWLREQRGADGLWRCDVVQRGRSCLFDAMAAARDLGYQPRVSVADGMQALSAWAREVGGPQAIARLARAPADKAELDSFVQLADATSKN